jgi:glycogen debranching enzyme
MVRVGLGCWSFCRSLFKNSRKSALSFLEEILYNFEEDIINHGIGTISEIYDGDPPHSPRGAISQAWSVAELIRIHYMLLELKNNN